MNKSTQKNKINIRHIGLVVKDLNESLKFWRDCFKFKIISHMEEKSKSLDLLMKLNKVNVITCKIKDNRGNIIELLQYKKPISQTTSIKYLKPNSLGITHLAITVKNINLIIKKIKKYGYDIISEPLLSDDHSVKYSYIKTTDGIYLEVVEELK